MEISFANESVKAPLQKEHTRHAPATEVTREHKLDSLVGTISAGLNSRADDSDLLLEQTVEASANEGAIDGAHDFNMARVMELLSDPLLQKDIP